MKWNRNLLKIPDLILKKIRESGKKDFVVACVKRVKLDDIKNGDFEHLGLIFDGKVEFETPILPPPDSGKYSRINVEGNTIVRRDLPMIEKTTVVDSPNWGDWSKGSHEVALTRDVYQREFVPPLENQIEVKLEGKEEGFYVFRFTVPEVLRVASRGFRKKVLFNMNLLQENVGASGVFPSDAKQEDYLKSVYVGWEILPPGEREQNVVRILKGLGRVTDDVKKKILDRYDFFERLEPEALIHGHGGFRGYFGAKFSKDFVVFENMHYGNALYAMFTEWEEQSKKTKQELLRTGREGKDYVRIVHTVGWKQEVRDLVNVRRSPKKRS